MLQVHSYNKMRNILTLSYRLNALNCMSLPASRLIKRNIHYVGNHRQLSILCKSNNTCYINYCNDFTAKWFSITPVLGKTKNAKKKSKEDLKIPPKATQQIADALDIDKLKLQYDKGLEYLKENLIKHLSLRTNVGAIEAISVKFNEKEFRLEQLAQISRKPKLVVLNVSAFPEAVPNILDALRKSHMNLNPHKEGNVINVPIPIITREYKESLLKSGKMYVSKFRNTATDIRNKTASELQDRLDKSLYYKVEGYLNELNKYYIAIAEDMLEVKKKEFTATNDKER